MLFKSMFKNKKILFIGPVFHEYHSLITEKLISMGADVKFHPERTYGLTFKIINNFFNKHLKDYQATHYRKLTEQIRADQFDYLFVVRGYQITDEFLVEFKRLNPQSKMIMYQWDSNKTNPYAHLLDRFDHAYSFDFEDCRVFPALNYIPLFFSDDVKTIISDKKQAAYDFFFMGWFFPERYQAVVKFKEYAETNGFKLKAFLYMPLSSYIKERLKGVKLDMTIVSFKRMKRNDYLEFLKQTKVMVDVSSPNQTGLAMRVIEALASNTKILTNNHKIKDDPEIYNTDRIAFLDEKEPFVEPSFLDFKAGSANNKLLPIEEWLKRIFFSN